MATTITTNYASLVGSVLQGRYVALILQSGVEVSGGGYVRQPLPAFNVSSDTTNIYLKNSTTIAFPIATSDWATVGNMINKIRIYDNQTAGNLLAEVDLPLPKPCYTGDQIIFPANNITITLPITT